MTYVNTGLFYFAVLLIVVFSIFPFYYAIITSLKTGTAIFTINYLPRDIDFSNYVNVLTGRTFIRNLGRRVSIICE